MIVDAHGHYNTKKDFLRNAEKYATDELAKRVYERSAAGGDAPSPVEEATTAEAWHDSLDQYGVDKVLLQVAPFGGNDAVADFIKKSGSDRFVGIGNIDFIDPVASSSVAEVERIKELGLKGIGELYPPIGPWNPGDEKFFPIYEKAQEMELPIMVHLCSEGYPAPFVNLAFNDPYLLDPALRAFPDLPFIFCHMAGDYIHHLFVLMCARRNVYGEISSNTWGGVPTPYMGFFDITPKQILQKFLQRGFADRLLWGTDVQGPYFLDIAPSGLKGTIKENIIVRQLDELNASEEAKANILGDNAARVFKL